MALIPAYQKDEQLLADIEKHAGDDTVHLWWLGQSGFLATWKNMRVLIDPYLSDSLTKKYLHTQKPHTRMSELVVNPALLRNISVVSSSHNHTDHLDAETLIPLISNNPQMKMVIPEANRAFVCERVHMPLDFPIGMNDGDSIVVNGVQYKGIPAAHNEVERDEAGRCRFMGYVISIGGVNIYHSGDTLLFPGMEALLGAMDIDVAILPINGNDPSRGVAGNLDSSEAAKLAKAIGAKLTIPCHYDMFTFNTADPKTFEREASALQLNFRILQIGERTTIIP